MSPSSICRGCQRGNRGIPGVKNNPPAKHNCVGGNCRCGSCHALNPVPVYDAARYDSWMGMLGALPIEGATVLGETAIEGFNIIKDAVAAHKHEAERVRPASGQASEEVRTE